MTHQVVNLLESFGTLYRVTFDPGYDPRGVPKRRLDPWMMQLPCRRGVIYPFGGDRLAVEVDYHSQAAKKLAAVPGVELWQDGDHETTFLFPVNLFDRVASLVGPRKRRRCHLSPEQLRAG